MPLRAPSRPAARRAAPLLLAFALFACGEGEHPLRRVERGEAEVTGHGVVVFAIDGLRYDRTSLGRTDRDTTPFLARLAAEGAELADTWSPIALRFDAHVALLTGLDPILARRPPVQGAAGAAESAALPVVVPLAAPSIAVKFLAGGYDTAAFVDHPDLAQVRGLDRGFREFRAYAGRGDEDDRRGDGIVGVGARFVEWLNAHELDEDWFAYVHMGDLERRAAVDLAAVPPTWALGDAAAERLPVARTEPVFHALPPSRVPAGVASVAELELAYDAALLALDRRLERIVRLVDAYGRGARVTVVIVGTYGVPFGESGVYLTPGLPDAPDLRVPWVVRPAAALELTAGRRIDAVASLLDVGPTLLELAGLAPPASLHGFSRAAELRSSDAPTPRRRTFALGHIGAGACVATDNEQWGLLAPAPADTPLAESWGGRRDVERGLQVVRTRTRSGPRSVDTFGFPNPAPEPGRDAGDLPVLFQRWAALTAEARDALHFGASRALEEYSAGLRALQSD